MTGQILNHKRTANGVPANGSSKRVALLLNDNVTGNIIANQLIPKIRGLGCEPVIFMLYPPPPAQPHNPDMDAFSFFESGTNGASVFSIQEKLLSKFSRQAKPTNLSFRQLNLQHGVEIREFDDINLINAVKRVEADTTLIGGISIRNLQIFRQPLIDTFRKKGFFWNLHSGLLPAYRGVHPQLRALANGEKECGWTLHEIDEGIDTGNILGAVKTPLRREQPYLSQFHGKLGAAIPLVADKLQEFITTGRNTVIENPVRRNTGAGQYYTFPTSVETAAWKDSGITIADCGQMADILTQAYAPKQKILSNLFRDAVNQEIGAWSVRRLGPDASSPWRSTPLPPPNGADPQLRACG